MEYFLLFTWSFYTISVEFVHDVFPKHNDFLSAIFNSEIHRLQQKSHDNHFNDEE